MSDEDLDLSFALDLLCGYQRRDYGNPIPTGLEFFSKTSHTTEDRARESLVRVLLSGKVPPVLLWALAAVFAPKDFRGKLPLHSSRHVTFQNRTKGHPNPDRDFEIAYQVDSMRRNGETLEDACEYIAEFQVRGLSAERIEKIYRNTKLGFDPPPPAPRRKSGKRR